MRHSKKKKTILGTGISLLAPAITRLVSGNMIEGYILIAMSVGLILLYDYLDDKAKGEPVLPSGMDKETFTDLARISATQIDDIRNEDSK